MLFKVLPLILYAFMISSSIVLDSAGQRSIYLNDYCPKMQYCAEGAHVMCMYYNAKNPMGPSCSNAQNISMTQELANKLLDVSNAIRGRIAQGKEKGKNGNSLPRGYGIFRLNWDTELSTFAQVLANQCVLRHDLCRATKRFPDPGQTAGLVRFTYPDWFPVSKSGNFTTPGLDPTKLLYATTQILKSWYGQKNSVTPNMITFYPDWASNPNSQDGRLYLEMIYGSATHMGCGISAYTEYAFHDNNAAFNYNSIQIICNYSARPRKGTAVYNTVPPGDTAEPFSRCGCPVGSEADEECLCRQVQRNPLPIKELKAEIHQCPDGECDPTVVVLPVFTVEDAPPEKLFNRNSFSNFSLRRPIHNSIFQSGYDSYQNKRNAKFDKRFKPRAYEYKDKSSQRQSHTQSIRPKFHQVAIRNRYFDKKHIESQQRPSQVARNSRKKTSLFTRAAKFELPSLPNIRPTKQTALKDVLPRKDFTNAKQLVNKYLYGEKDLPQPLYNKTMVVGNKAEKPEENVLMPRMTDNTFTNLPRNNNMQRSLIKDKHTVNNMLREFQRPNIANPIIPEHREIKNTIDNKHHFNEVFNSFNGTKSDNIKHPIDETTLNMAEQSVLRQKELLKQIVSKKNNYKPLNSVTEETDNKLIALLDTLEQEIRHVELRDKDKQLFDAKIRKIYGKVVGKPAGGLDIKYIKSKETLQDLQQPYVMNKSVEQGSKDISFVERYREKNIFDDPNQRSDMNFNNDPNLIRNRNKIDKYDEQRTFTKPDDIRRIQYIDRSNDPMRYRNYETDQSERNIYRNNGFDRNTLTDLDEHMYTETDIKYRSRNTEKDRHYKEDELDRRNGNKLEHRNTNRHYNQNIDLEQTVRRKNYYPSNEVHNDALSIERRRLYQEKLDNVEKNLQMRNFNKRKDKTRHMRPVRPAPRKSESQMDIYGRGRFAHGY